MWSSGWWAVGNGVREERVQLVHWRERETFTERVRGSEPWTNVLSLPRSRGCRARHRLPSGRRRTWALPGRVIACARARVRERFSESAGDRLNGHDAAAVKRQTGEDERNPSHPCSASRGGRPVDPPTDSSLRLTTNPSKRCSHSSQGSRDCAPSRSSTLSHSNVDIPLRPSRGNDCGRWTLRHEVHG